ncbi:MAG: FimV/HubP family polar landmark protein [Methylotenera sp.]
MHKSKIKQISLAVCLAFMPLSGFAAGLGKLNVNSGLGEPLKAEIELLSVSPEELSTLSAAIASEEAYSVQGITRLGIHNNIKVELAKNADGSPVLKVRSSQPISDPYLDMLIQVDWASGRLLREYTVLLDPPEYKQAINEAPVSASIINKPSITSRATAASKERVAAEVDSNAIADTQQATKKSKKSKKVSSQAAEQQAEFSTPTDTPQLMTVRGDTLNSIAKEMQMEGVSLDQMLVGLYENNKSAFVDGNMNRLKVGQIVKAPSKDTLTAISPQQARQSVKVHSANWNTYRNNLAGNVLAAPVDEEGGQKQSASGKIASAEDKAAPIKPGSQDVVKLSAGDKVPTKDGKAGANFDSKIMALQEEATAREKALKESQERTAALETQIADMQKLLALKNQTLTDLQKNAETVAKPTESNQAVAAPAQPPSAAVSVPVPEQTVAKEVKKTPPVVKAPAQPEPAPEPTFIESLLGGGVVDLTILGGAAGVALLGAGWMFLRNKRRKDLDSFERGILTSGGLRANTVFGNTTGNASTSDTSFLTDFAQSADGSMIDTNDVDPIAEAEVYMAYGRDAQAEEILKDAISKEPKRYELHLKLLEMYAGRKDISAFEAIAGELYTTLGADDPTWAKVAELGATVEPDNPLYDVSKIVASTEVATSKQDVENLDDVKASVSDGLDFSFDDEPVSEAQSTPEDPSSVVMQSFASTKDAEQNQAFDLGSLDDGLSMEASAADVQAGESIANIPKEGSAVDNSMDFDLTNLDSTSLDSASLDSVSLSAGSQDSGLSDDLLSTPEVASSQDSASPYEFTSSLSDNNQIEFGAAGAPESSKSDEIEFGLDFNFPDTTTEDTSIQTQDVALDTTDFNFEGFDNALTQPDDKKAEEISFDFPLSDDQVPLVATEEASTSNQQDANKFDFSSISLDLSEDESQASAEPQPAIAAADFPASVTSENPDVDIKLDLVTAYIDMDDKEGARELLDEVTKEGGPQQRLRAEQLLANLA